jgi:hypothetical protein
MKGIIRSLLRFAIALLGAALVVASSQAQTGPAAAQSAAGTARHQGTFFDFMRWLAQRGVVVNHAASSRAPVLARPDLEGLSVSTRTIPAAAGDPVLPVWNFTARSSRDGHRHSGTMVGTSPFSSPGSTTVTTQIVPLIIRTHTLATSFDPTTGTLGTAPGEFTTDPTEPQSSCLTAPNNVPLTLLQQSPLFTPAAFTFGAVSVGTTQYIDAFMRANFWNVLGSNSSQYHVLLGAQVLEPVEIDVPANEGLAVQPAVLGLCAPLTIVDINWLDAYLNGTVLPRLAEQGVNPGTLPLYFPYNVVEASPVTNLFTCCVLGYHSVTGHPLPTQTYAIGDFDETGAFPSAINDSAVLSHELGEWVNDPYTVNQVAPWGNIGQVGGCSNVLEVGDPLTGTEIPAVIGANGFSYDLQELAFYSWFIGAPATGANGWFSNNGTFLTDAGPPCP